MDSLIIPQAIYQAMQDDVQRRLPEEACGLLGGAIQGRSGIVRRAWAVSNALHSPQRYRLEPAEQWAAFAELAAGGWQLLAIYHSHPQGPAGLSETDLSEAWYPQAAYLVWSPTAAGWRLDAFRINSADIHPIFIQRE